jgi:NarL family two-component system response regulator LiaR
MLDEDTTKLKVAIVDDHSLVREGLRHILSMAGDIEVVGEASTGEEALALVDKLKPNVILLDVSLPGINGIEVAQKVKSGYPDVRVLMLSAYEDVEYLRGAIDAGASGYVLKTTPGHNLIEAIRMVASGMEVLDKDLAKKMRQGEVVELPEGQLLSPREIEIIKLLAQGLSNKQIAVKLGISRRTVERHLETIYNKMAVNNRTEAVMKAVQLRLLY